MVTGMMVQITCQTAGQPQVNQVCEELGATEPNHCTPGGWVMHAKYGGGPSELADRSLRSFRYVASTLCVWEYVGSY